MQQIWKSLQQGKVSPLYVLYGSEDYVREETIRRIQAALQQKEDVETDGYDLNEVSVQELVMDAETVPFFSAHRLLIGREATFLTGAKQKQKVEHVLDSILSYATNPASFSTVVLTVRAEKLDERKKIVKTLKSAGEVISCQPPNVENVQKMVYEYIQENQVAISQNTLAYFITLCQGTLTVSMKEAEKLILYTGAGGTITQEICDQLVSKTLDANVFTFLEHVVHQRTGEAFRLLEDLLKQKEEPIRMLALLHNQFRLMAQVRGLEGKGYSEKKMASILSVHPFRVKMARTQGKAFPNQKLKDILQTCANTDVAMKTGTMDKELAFEMLLFTIVK